MFPCCCCCIPPSLCQRPIVPYKNDAKQTIFIDHIVAEDLGEVEDLALVIANWPKLAAYNSTQTHSGRSYDPADDERIYIYDYSHYTRQDQSTPKGSRFSCSPTETKCPKVSFGSLTVRKYEMILGDHPDCAVGPPVGIGWRYEQIPDMPVEVWETYRSPRRHDEGLLLHWRQRRDIVSKIASKEEIQIAMENATKVRRRRQQSSMDAPHNQSNNGRTSSKKSAADLTRGKIAKRHVGGHRPRRKIRVYW